MWGRRALERPDPALAELRHVCAEVQRFGQAVDEMSAGLLAIHETIGAIRTRLERIDGRLDAFERWADDNADVLAAAGAQPYPPDRSRFMPGPQARRTP